MTGIADNKIVFLAGAGELTNIVFNRLNQSIPIEIVIIENFPSKLKLIKNRVKKLGLFKVCGQLIFQIFIVKLLAKRAAKRIKVLKELLQLDSNPISHTRIKKVKSANDENTINLLKQCRPKIVIVNGTCILSQKVLDCCDALFINIHTGITPMYRGVHGAYWALVENNPKKCGVTVHIIDKGVDTGPVLYQDTIEVTNDDNFTTYPYLQLAKGLPLLVRAIKDILHDDLKLMPTSVTNSKQYYHPTFIEYFLNRWFKKVS